MFKKGNDSIITFRAGSRKFMLGGGGGGWEGIETLGLIILFFQQKNCSGTLYLDYFFVVRMFITFQNPNMQFSERKHLKW